MFKAFCQLVCIWFHCRNERVEVFASVIEVDYLNGIFETIVGDIPYPVGAIAEEYDFLRCGIASFQGLTVKSISEVDRI